MCELVLNQSKYTNFCEDGVQRQKMAYNATEINKYTNISPARTPFFFERGEQRHQMANNATKWRSLPENGDQRHA